MTDVTARLGLPLIVPGQAQKEMSHNEALAALDVAVQACVLDVGIAAPPADPAPGDCWIVGTAPTGVFAGHAAQIAAWTTGGWRFIEPRPGFRAWITDARVEARFVDGAWQIGQVPPVPLPPIGDPTGGATIDSAARATIAQILAALRHHNLVLAP